MTNIKYKKSSAYAPESSNQPMYMFGLVIGLVAIIWLVSSTLGFVIDRDEDVQRRLELFSQNYSDPVEFEKSLESTFQQLAGRDFLISSEEIPMPSSDAPFKKDDAVLEKEPLLMLSKKKEYLFGAISYPEFKTMMMNAYQRAHSTKTKPNSGGQ